MSNKSVKFHVESNDYFGTLATVLSMIKQTPEHINKHIKSLNKLEKDLMFLQKEYKIVKK
ncbi:MAG: hypothetical protein WCW61_03645 [Patescibacteria group bacterium]|jgi:hypothetical protein